MKKTIFVLLLVLTYSIQAQISESFEGATFPPTGWLAYPGTSGASDAEWEISNLQSHTGSKSAYSGFDDAGASEGWLVTPQVTLTAANHVLSFYQRQFDENSDYGSVYTVRISTASQNTHADFTIVDTQTEADFNETWSLHTVDLNAYVGQAIYIAFVHAQDDGDNWYIDSVFIEPQTAPTGITTNPTPTDGATDVSIINSQTSVIDFSWQAPTTGIMPDFYDFYLGVDQNNLRKLGTRQTTDAHPHTFHFNTTYYWKAVGGNTAGSAQGSSVWSFSTVAQPTVSAPYTVDFENAGHIPDGMDQLITNSEFWRFTDSPGGHIGNAGSFEGTTSASGGYFAYVDDSNPNSLGTTILTPFVNLSSLTTPGLSFYMISNNEGSTNVDFSVHVWDGAAWQQVFSSNTNTTGWEKKEINLSGITFQNDITQIKFVVDETQTGFKDDLAIDDIVINEFSTSSTAEFSTKQFKVYPNPVRDILYVSGMHGAIPAKVELYDITGKLVNTYYNKTQISFRKLNNGIYMLKIYDKKNSSIIKKILK